MDTMTTDLAGAEDRAPSPGALGELLRRRAVRRFALRALTFAVPIAAWVIVARLGLMSRSILPTPASVLEKAIDLLGAGEFWSAVNSTVEGAAIGLFIAIVSMIPLGLLIGRSTFAYRSTYVVIDVARSFPFIGLIPVLILLLGVNMTLQVVLVTTACAWPLLLQSIYGTRDLDAALDETMKSYRIPRWLWATKVLAPNALPYIGTGLRLAISTAILVAIGVEVLTAVPGIGLQIASAQRVGATTELYAYLVYAALIGVLVSAAATRLERLFLRWQPSTEGTSS